MTIYSELIENLDNGIFIISKESCELCDKLKELFDTIEVEYTLYKYEEEKDNNLKFKTDMKIATGGKQFPFCYFNGEYVGGYKEIHRNLITGGLKEKLNDIGIDYEEDF